MFDYVVPEGFVGLFEPLVRCYCEDEERRTVIMRISRYKSKFMSGGMSSTCAIRFSSAWCFAKSAGRALISARVISDTTFSPSFYHPIST